MYEEITFSAPLQKMTREITFSVPFQKMSENHFSLVRYSLCLFNDLFFSLGKVDKISDIAFTHDICWF